MCFYVRRRSENDAFSVVSVSPVRYPDNIKFARICLMDVGRLIRWTIIVNEHEGFAFRDVAHLNAAVTFFGHRTKNIELDITISQHPTEYQSLKSLCNPLLTEHTSFYDDELAYLQTAVTKRTF